VAEVLVVLVEVEVVEVGAKVEMGRVRGTVEVVELPVAVPPPVAIVRGENVVVVVPVPVVVPVGKLKIVVVPVPAVVPVTVVVV